MVSDFNIIEQRLRDRHREFAESAKAIAKNLGEDPTQRIEKHAAKTEAKIEEQRLNFQMYHGQ